MPIFIILLLVSDIGTKGSSGSDLSPDELNTGNTKQKGHFDQIGK